MLLRHPPIHQRTRAPCPTQMLHPRRMRMMALPPRQLNQRLILLRLLSLETVHPRKPPVSTFDISHYPLLSRKTVAPISLLSNQPTKYYNHHGRRNHQPERHDIKRYVRRLQLAGECQTRPSCHELTDSKRNQETNRQNEKCRSHTYPEILEYITVPSLIVLGRTRKRSTRKPKPDKQ